MFKKPSKKQLLIRRIAVSVVATIAVAIIVTVSILFMLGYRLDSGNKLSQGALLQFDSRPSGARVFVDGYDTGSQTASKQTVVAGEHSVKMTKAGYEDWNRTLSIEPGTLTWLDYIRLVPKNRPVEVVGRYNSLVAMQFSPDLKWALGQEGASVPTFRLIDLRSTEIKNTFLALPSTLYSAADIPEASHTFSIYRWSTGGRYAIIKHVYQDTKTEWIMLDTQDVTRSVNITRMLNVDLMDVQFAATSGMGVYGLSTDGVLRKLDLSSEMLSRGLITNVTSFRVFEEGSAVSYIGKHADMPNQLVAGIYKDGDSAPHILRTIDERTHTSFSIALTRYFGDDYVAIAEGTDLTLLTGNLPSSNQEATTLRSFATLTSAHAVTTLSFSPKGDYLIAQYDGGFLSYELEHKRTHVAALSATDGTPNALLRWLDDAHLWNDNDNTLMMRDFDGTNTHQIMPVERGYGASLSQNGRYIYAVGKGDDGRFQLQRVLMILE